MRYYLSKNSPIQTKKPVSMDYELSSLVSKLESSPVLISLKEYPNVKAVAGLCGNRDSLARSVNTTKEQMIFKISKSMDEKGSLTISNNAPFLENKIEDPDIIQHIPVPIYYRQKDRRYFSSSIVIARNSETGSQNLSFHRMMYLGKNKFVVRITPRHLYELFTKEKESLEVAVVLGVNPAIEVAAATSYTPDFDELKFASALLGGMNVAKVGNILVPSESEIVMHGRITKETADEGPFVDLTGTIDPERKQHVFVCDTLYYRKDPYFRVIIPGGLEHRILMGVPQEPRIYKLVSNTVPSVKNVCLTEGGCCWLHAVVSIKKRKEGDGKNAILATLAAHPSLKKVTVVDDDIDIFNPVSVEWALATRFQPGRDLLVVRGARGSSLDPTSDLETQTTDKWGIDATSPLSREAFLFEKVRLPMKLNEKEYL